MLRSKVVVAPGSHWGVPASLGRPHSSSPVAIMGTLRRTSGAVYP